MNSKGKRGALLILLIVIAHIPMGGSNVPPKKCACIAQKSLCKQPPSSNLGYYATAAACLAPFGAVAAAGPLLGLMGFTAGGIAGGSVGAWLMSLSAGKVAAGSMVALLQSWGAAGVGAGVWATAGSMVATCAAIFYPGLLTKYSTEPGCESSTDFVCFFNEDYTGAAGYATESAPMKASDKYPEGKKVAIEELYDTPLYMECDIQ